MKNHKDIFKEFDDKFVFVDWRMKDVVGYIDDKDGSAQFIKAFKIRKFIRKALKQNDTKWKKKIEELDREWREKVEGLRPVGDIEDERHFKGAEIKPEVAYELGRHDERVESNSKINQLLEEA